MLFARECPVCGRDDSDPSGRGGVCRGCVGGLGPPPDLAVPDGLGALRALTAYAGVGRGLVTALKYRNHRTVVPFAAHRLAGLMRGDTIEVVTWAPTTARRRRERGFDQAELLARRVARELEVGAYATLVRVPGTHQTGLDRAARLPGPRFDARRGVTARVRGRRVALVDDVATTGATLTRAAAVLRANGAREVVGVVIARTPDDAGARAGVDQPV